MRKTHGSEVNIYRVMTRNESAVFKEEVTLAAGAHMHAQNGLDWLGDRALGARNRTARCSVSLNQLDGWPVSKKSR